ncbi:MAG: putative DNA-binding domain-containing protein [Rhizobiales bacterium]|nr:putative DNA-binding domain-containing protein [Hyphomicrobiales bacterium]
MSSLAELQSLMTSAIFKGHAADIEESLLAGRADPARRFNIYRNNTFLSLSAHLKAVFPVTAKLGDERFFAYAANEFIRRSPPREPRLSAYGAEFPKFLARFPASRAMPILAEMASLEWAVQSALTTGTMPSVSLDALIQAGPEAAQARLALQPGLNFILSRWPLAMLWMASGEIAEPPARVSTRLAVWRAADSVRVVSLSKPRFAFWRALVLGLPLEAAAARAVARDDGFDFPAELRGLFGAGLVTGIAPQPNLH